MNRSEDHMDHIIPSVSSPAHQVEMLCDLYAGFGPAS